MRTAAAVIVLAAPHGAGDRLVGREFVEVGQGEQRLGADHNAEFPLQLTERLRVLPARVLSRGASA